MIERFRNFCRDIRGTVTIELALVAPLLALMVIGMTDVSMAYSRKLALEQGAQRAIEKVMQTTGSTTVADTIKSEVVCQVNGVDGEGACNASPITAADVTVTYRLECVADDGTRTEQTSGDADTFDAYTCAADETPERYMNVQVASTYAPMFPIYFGDDADGDYHIDAAAGVRTQ
jgi:Flp pilus assembly protein TadG